MTRISIVFHSGFGHTAVMAEEVKAGAEAVTGVAARLVPVDQLEGAWSDLAASDAIVFGSPTYMGTVSAPFKAFMDATSQVWLARGWQNKLAAGFTISGSPSGDKLNTLQTLMTFALQHGMVWVGNAESSYNAEGINRLGSYVGIMGQAGQVAPDVEPNEADRRTARVFGQRVAEAAARWKRGA